MRILDRYLLRQFATTFVFALMALSTIFVIIDLFERLDKIIDNRMPLDAAATFYLVMLPYFLEMLVPVALMLAGLFSVGRLSSLNEITAMRSSGLGTLRLLMPILVFALVVSFGQLYFNGWVVPRAATVRFDLERRYLGSEGGRQSLSDLAFRETPTRNVLMRRYEDDRRLAVDVAIEEFGSVTSPRLAWRIDADSMRWDEAKQVWTILSGRKRTFHADTVMVETIRTMDAPFSVRHDQIVKLRLNPEEMTFPELEEYIATLKRGGKDTRTQEIDMAGQWAFPFVDLIVVIISVPFASVRRRGGIAVNIAAAMVLSITYIAFTKISQAVGASTDLSPVLVAWSANATFFVVGIGVLYKAR